MAGVERLREELMESLGFEVEASAAARGWSEERASSASRWGGKGRRRQEKVAVQRGVPDPQALRQGQEEREERGCALSGDGRMADTRIRPHSAKLFRASSRNWGRPTSASSARCPVGSSIVNGGYGANNDMDVLLQICRDQGRTGSLDPADFDSSISAIANLPVKQFMGAAKDGWGPYFRNLHNKMRKEATAQRTAARTNRPPPDRQREPGQATSPRPRRAPSSGATRSSQSTTAYRQLNKAAGNSRQVVRNTITDINSLTRRRRRQREDGNNFDGLAASRARAAKREEEEEVVGKMAMRLQALWEELKIPSPDRAYVTATYLEARGRGGGRDGDGSKDAKGTSAYVYHELARQIRLLLEHRAATIQVLRAVILRESRLAEVEQALQAFQWHRGLDTDAIGAVSALAGLRDASLYVVRSVVEWRKNLCQPRAFCWQGVNYLEKMSQDTGFLRSPVGISFLASVGLEACDMTFVLFPTAGGGGGSPPPPPPGEEDDAARRKGLDAEGKVGMGIIQPPPAIVSLTPKAELVSEYRARFFKPSSAAADVNIVGAEGGVEKRGGGEGREGGGRPQTSASRGAVVLPTANEGLESVVMQEAALQRRVEAERARLATKGCFVPLLRWLPGDNPHASPKGKRRQSFPLSPPVPPLPAKASAAPMPATQTDTKTGETSTLRGSVDPATGCPNAAALPPSAPLTTSSAPLPPSGQQQQQQQEKHTPPLAASKVQGSTSSRAQLGRPAAPLKNGGQRGEHDEGNSEEEEECAEREEHGNNLRSGEAEPGQTEQVHVDAAGRASPERTPLQRASVQHTDDGLQQVQPLGVEAGRAGEAEVRRRMPEVGGDEGRAGLSEGTRESSEGSSRGDDGGIDATPCPSGRRQQQQEQEEHGCGDECDEERSIAPSACYDDDFEDDAKEYSGSEGGCLSDNSANEQGGSRSQPKDDIDAHREKGNRPPHGVEGASERGAAGALDETNASAFPGGEGLEAAFVTDTKERVDGRQRQQQLLEERESAVAAATRRIQKSARAWLRHRSRLREEQAGLEETHAELQQQQQQQEEEHETNTTKEKQEWLASWRAERQSQVRQTQVQQQGSHVDAAATRMQTAVRGYIASGQVNELRRRSNARRLAAAAKIQAFVRSRRRHTASQSSHRCLVEGPEHQQEVGSNRHATAVDGTNPRGSDGERALSPVPADLGSGEATARQTRIALTIQKATRRVGNRSKLSSERISGGIGGSPLTETSGHQIELVPGDAQGELSEGGEGEGTAKPDTVLFQRGGSGAAATFSQEQAVSDGALSSPSFSELEGPGSSSSSSSGGSVDLSLSDDDSSSDNSQLHDGIGRQSGMSGGGGGSEGSGDVSRIRPNAEDPSAVVEACQTFTTSTPEEGPAENNSTATTDKDGYESQKPGEVRGMGQDGPRPPAATNPGGGETNDLSTNAVPADTDTSMDAMMTTTVVGAASSSGPSVVGLSPVPERQVLVAVAVAVAASASEYGSEDLNFDALSSSPGSSLGSSSGRGSERRASTSPVAGAGTASPTATTGGASVVAAGVKNKLRAESNQGVNGPGTAGAAREPEIGGAGGSSDESSLVSLSLSSGS